MAGPKVRFWKVPGTLAIDLPGLGPDREVAAALANRLKRFRVNGSPSYEGKLPLSELAKDLHCSRGAILSVLRRLEVGGFIATVRLGTGTRPSTIRALDRLTRHFDGSVNVLPQGHTGSCSPREHYADRSVRAVNTSVRAVNATPYLKERERKCDLKDTPKGAPLTAVSAAAPSATPRRDDHPLDGDGQEDLSLPATVGAYPLDRSPRIHAGQRPLSARDRREVTT